MDDSSAGLHIDIIKTAGANGMPSSGTTKLNLAYFIG